MESTIENFYEDYLKIPNNGMFAVFKKRNYMWNDQNELITPISRNLSTKTIREIKEAAHVLYASRMDIISDSKFMGDFQAEGGIKLFPMDDLESFDIDYDWQFKLGELIYDNLRWYW